MDCELLQQEELLVARVQAMIAEVQGGLVKWEPIETWKGRRRRIAALAIEVRELRAKIPK